MSNLQVVTGAGPVGWTVAEQLAGRGHRVRVLTRSGSGPEHPLVERRRVDVSDPALLGPALEGAGAVYHCIHGSAYRADTWERELPAAENAVLEAAGRTGAIVVFPESLYSYSEPDRVMTEASPRASTTGKRGVRARLLDRRAESDTRTVSVVASDFFGPHARNAHAGERMVPTVLAGRSPRVLGSPDVPHSFTYVPDLAAAMIAAAANPAAWNRVLHAPTGPAGTQRELVAAFAAAAQMPAPKVGTIPTWLLRAGALVNRDARELAEMLYQFTDPFVMDSTYSEDLLGLRPTPLPEAAAATVRWWREQ
ncbi:NAD-dependent epimerase/dehydratase family protein [Rhodococcus ruber]|uniref:Putative NAD-dependent epimerase/dehydratase n=1 Tax=Rhodococcus ruber TaxID=1830 RepID=A0A098BNQ6_9NOCA|nr:MULTISPECIES: NAD-dependent epimerase/dehydratase family protein [Rhodococcus]MCD2125258.1 NAD-dependent epimerase/dehydratase family protein [Rhodococcus ruber]MCZ1073833.1 NAD-dependent epimerase/dehydratase family protein [Rhodococcus sp. A5(2022)]MCZ4501302.1 NAD-dependent epimerase/dehydratase family protein [Rhodococcus ruber]MCZ4528486.1 NAD-dependent epimerase/dehydratase family protein [Rhodococcus ruber]MCZ4619464.1 NAD-dependent epimerase/dehydratase family protein [Rhodococcus r